MRIGAEGTIVRDGIQGFKVAMAIAFLAVLPLDLSAQTVLPGDAVLPLFKEKFIEEFCKPTDPVRSCASISKESCNYQVSDFLNRCWADARLPWVPEKKTVAVLKQVGPCVAKRFVVGNKAQWQKTPQCSEWQNKRGQAGLAWVDSAETKEIRLTRMPSVEPPLEKMYILKMANSSDHLKKVQSIWGKEFQHVCLSHTGKDRYSCAKNLIVSYRVQFSVEMVLLSSLITDTMLRDRSLGYSETMLKLMGAENLILLLETVKPSEFYLAKARVVTVPNKTALAELKKTENKLLLQAFQSIIAMIDKNLEAVEKSQDPAAIQNLKVSKLRLLKPRFEKVKSLSMKLPN